MNVKERLQAIRLINKASTNPKLMKEMGISTKMIHQSQKINATKES